MLQVCLKGSEKQKSWYLDSGFSRHMTGDRSLFLTLTMKEGGTVGFGGNQTGKIIGSSTIEQVNIAGSEDSDDYSEPDQITEVNDTSEAITAPKTPEAEAAPDVPTAEASEEDHNASQQVIQSKNSFKYKSSHPEDQIIGNKDSP